MEEPSKKLFAKSNYTLQQRKQFDTSEDLIAACADAFGCVISKEVLPRLRVFGLRA